MERTKSEIKAQLDLGSLMMKMIYMFVPWGLICMISVYLTVNMLMEENRHNISMLKVLGYKNRRSIVWSYPSTIASFQSVLSSVSWRRSNWLG